MYYSLSNEHGPKQKALFLFLATITTSLTWQESKQPDSFGANTTFGAAARPPASRPVDFDRFAAAVVRASRVSEHGDGRSGPNHKPEATMKPNMEERPPR
jgi:hypothetical protein